MLKWISIFLIIWIFGLCHGEQTFRCKIKNEKTKCNITSQILSRDEKANFVMDPRSTEKQNVIEIWFNDSSLYSIPPEIFTSFVNLKHLYVRDQNLQEISGKTFEKASQLDYLSIKSNDIKVLHNDDFFGAIKLRILGLSKNKITTVHPHAFRGLDNLKELFLWGNKISDMSDQTFFNLHKLKKLQFHPNLCISEDFTENYDAVLVSRKLETCNENYLAAPCKKIVDKEIKIANKKFKDDIEVTKNEIKIGNKNFMEMKVQNANTNNEIDENIGKFGLEIAKINGKIIKIETNIGKFGVEIEGINGKISEIFRQLKELTDVAKAKN